MRKGFPPDVRQTLHRLAPYTGLVWQCDGEPGIIIKLPDNFSFPLVPISFDWLLRESPSKFSLTVQLQQQGYPAILVECRFSHDDPADTPVLHALLTATQLEVYAITPRLAFLGTQLLPWPGKKRRQLAALAHDLLATMSAQSEPPAVAPVPQETVQAAFLATALSSEQPGGDTGTALVQEQPPVAPVSPPAARPSVSSPARKPVVVAHALLIDRYIRTQRTHQQQEQIEQAHKFLWMHSAWAMSEVLLPGVGDGAVLRLPRNAVYIECEQPHLLAGMQVAACSLLRLSADERTKRSQWSYTLIADNGTPTLVLSYTYDGKHHQGTWSLPLDYACPDGGCQVNTTAAGQLFTLCTFCQERMDHLTAWLVVVLRMLAGDFQEQVELRQPEEVLETSKRTVLDKRTGEMKEKTMLHRFRVIRYYDACIRRGTDPQTRRGSWMSGRPLAESTYDVNPHAIIYVQIEPRDYERTYRHERYVHMRGKSQHIDPKARLQPMTIATFRQLPKRQRMTKVYASSFEE